MTGNLFPSSRSGNDLYQSLLETSLKEFLPELYRSINVAAVLPGVDDLLLGLDVLRHRLKECGLTPICANLVQGEGKAPVFEPFIVKEVGGYKIGITGLMATRLTRMEEPQEGRKPRNTEKVLLTRLMKDKDCEVLNPVTTALSLGTALERKGVDFIVALSYMSKKRDREVLANTPVDVIIGGSNCDENGFRMREGGIRTNTEHSGRWLGLLDIHYSGKGHGALGNRGKLENIQKELIAIRSDFSRLTARYGTDNYEKIKRLAQGTDDAAQFRKLASHISDLELPMDVMNDKVFEYSRNDTGALLQSQMPEGGDEVDIVRYQIILKKQPGISEGVVSQDGI